MVRQLWSVKTDDMGNNITVAPSYTSGAWRAVVAPIVGTVIGSAYAIPLVGAAFLNPITAGITGVLMVGAGVAGITIGAINVYHNIHTRNAVKKALTGDRTAYNKIIDGMKKNLKEITRPDKKWYNWGKRKACKISFERKMRHLIKHAMGEAMERGVEDPIKFVKDNFGLPLEKDINGNITCRINDFMGPNTGVPNEHALDSHLREQELDVENQVQQDQVQVQQTQAQDQKTQGQDQQATQQVVQPQQRQVPSPQQATQQVVQPQQRSVQNQQPNRYNYRPGRSGSESSSHSNRRGNYRTNTPKVGERGWGRKENKTVNLDSFLSSSSESSSLATSLPNVSSQKISLDHY